MTLALPVIASLLANSVCLKNRTSLTLLKEPKQVNWPGLQPNSEGLDPSSDGLHPSSDLTRV